MRPSYSSVRFAFRETRSHCDTDAAALLHRHQIAFTAIVRVDVDAILYLDDARRPMTAWLPPRGKQVEVATVPGFAAERSWWPSASSSARARSYSS